MDWRSTILESLDFYLFSGAEFSAIMSEEIQQKKFQFQKSLIKISSVCEPCSKTHLKFTVEPGVVCMCTHEVDKNSAGSMPLYF